MKLMTRIIITGLCAVLFLPGCKKTKNAGETLPEDERNFSRYRVIVDAAIIRQGAGKDTGVIGNVKAGELVLISGSTDKREVIGGREGVWMKAFVGGKDGFIFGGLIRPESQMFDSPYREDTELVGCRFVDAVPATSFVNDVSFDRDNVVEYMNSGDEDKSVYTGRYQVFGDFVFIRYEKKTDTAYNPMDGTEKSTESIYSGTLILRLERTTDPDSRRVVAVTNEEGEERMKLEPGAR